MTIRDTYTEKNQDAFVQELLGMDGEEAASTLVALLAIKALQDDPAWDVAKARVENAVKGLCQIVWEHYHGSVDNPARN